jgi:NAD(P)-dependent dehydrogenase (short-subunit alcohol dehydrogenase family)
MENKRTSSFAGKVAVVTGGGSGLGAALSRALAADGARVIVADLRGDMAVEVANAIGAEAAEVDVSDPKQIAELLEAADSKYGALDLVINNAGVLIGGEPLEIREEDWRRVIDVNLMGVIYGSLAALRIMAKHGSGQILNVTSVSGLALSPMLGAYSASKAGAVFFSRGLAEEAKGLGVHVATACPGNMLTPLAPSHVTPLMPPMEPDYAARRMLKALSRGRSIIVFPMYAKVWWWGERLSPRLLGPLRQVVVKRARARAAAASNSG